MQSNISDFHLSGFTHESFADSFLALKALGAHHHLWRLVAWDYAGRSNVTICDEGTSIFDFDGVLGFELSALKSFSAEYNVIAGAPVARILVTRQDEKLDVDGFLPIGATLSRFPELTPLNALTTYADFAVKAAMQLKTQVLVVAHEYSEGVIAGTSLSRPNLMAVFAERVAGVFLPDLQRKGVQVDSPMGGVVRVWLQSPTRFALGEEPAACAVEAMEEVIRQICDGHDRE